MENLLKKEINNNVIKIFYLHELYAIIIKKDFNANVSTFFTPESFSQQLGFLFHKKNSVIKAHIHKVIKREVDFTNEVLIIKQGKLMLNLYSDKKEFLGSEYLGKDDILLLCKGGHEFKIIEDTKMIEIKQGPYAGIDDKIKFNGIAEENI